MQGCSLTRLTFDALMRQPTEKSASTDNPAHMQSHTHAKSHTCNRNYTYIQTIEMRLVNWTIAQGWSSYLVITNLVYRWQDHQVRNMRQAVHLRREFAAPHALPPATGIHLLVPVLRKEIPPESPLGTSREEGFSLHPFHWILFLIFVST